MDISVLLSCAQISAVSVQPVWSEGGVDLMGRASPVTEDTTLDVIYTTGLTLNNELIF